MIFKNRHNLTCVDVMVFVFLQINIKINTHKFRMKKNYIICFRGSSPVGMRCCLWKQDCG